MSRHSTLLPGWAGCRHLPLLACAALSFRTTSPVQAQSGSTQPVPAAPAGTAVETPASPAEAAERGFLGVSLTELRPEVRAQTALKEGEGLMIGLVAIGSPAAHAGLCPYDILLRFNDQWVISEKQVATLVENAGPGCEVELTLLHKGKEQRTKVSLCRSPKPEERVKIRSLPLPPPQDEMLASLMHTFNENPATLESVWRMFHGPLGAVADVGQDPTTRRFMFWDEGGQVELIQNGNMQRLRAWDAQGHLVFDGPCRTPQQRADIPAEALVRLEALEKRRNMQTPPMPGARPQFSPVLPVPAAPAPSDSAAQRTDSSPGSR
ncbi:MAG: PDZ domain-containing protein [Verrucomicrobiota bacterium]